MVVGAAIILFVGGLLAVWFLPSGPSIIRPGVFVGFEQGYVGTHYVSWPAFSAQETFKIASIDVRVDDPTRCDAVVRKMKRPADSFEAITDGPLPGTPAIGGLVSHAASLDYAIVLTPHQVGECTVTSVTVGARSLWKIRTSTVISEFTVTTSHTTGDDPRVRDALSVP
jgi:hypothetical protein